MPFQKVFKKTYNTEIKFSFSYTLKSLKFPNKLKQIAWNFFFSDWNNFTKTLYQNIQCTHHEEVLILPVTLLTSQLVNLDFSSAVKQTSKQQQKCYLVNATAYNEVHLLQDKYGLIRFQGNKDISHVIVASLFFFCSSNVFIDPWCEC